MDAILARNRQWALQKKSENPHFFSELSSGQSPSIFWVGCCDSRIIPTEIFDLSLGEFFIQTNIANQVNSKDGAMMGALYYAVDVLQVEQIIICGHTHCGGIQAALDSNVSAPSLVTDWIKPIAERYRKKVEEGKITAENVVELNVQDQLRELKMILGKHPKLPKIGGQVFDMEKGLITKTLFV